MLLLHCGNILLLWLLLCFLGIMTGRAVYFSFLAAWIEPVDTVRASPQTGGFQASPSLISLSAVSQVWHLQQRVIEGLGQSLETVLLVPSTPLTNLKGGSPWLTLCFYYLAPFLAFFVKWGSFFFFFFKYVCILTYMRVFKIFSCIFSKSLVLSHTYFSSFEFPCFPYLQLRYFTTCPNTHPLPAWFSQFLLHRACVLPTIPLTRASCTPLHL